MVSDNTLCSNCQKCEVWEKIHSKRELFQFFSESFPEFSSNFQRSFLNKHIPPLKKRIFQQVSIQKYIVLKALKWQKTEDFKNHYEFESFFFWWGGELAKGLMLNSG